MTKATPPPPPPKKPQPAAAPSPPSQRATPPPPPSQRKATTPSPAEPTRPTPAPQPTPTAQPTPKLSIDRVLSQLDQPVQPVDRSSYKSAVFFVASMMILVPLVYLLLIVGVVVLLIVLTANFSSVASNPIGMAFYGMLLLFGSVFVLFMLKPLFARRGAGSRVMYSLDPNREPVLFAFIERLAVSLNTPKPKRIEILMNVNAYASFRRSGLFGESYVVLCIGLPLAAGLSMRQFAGVLAHELGHFTQGSAMRLSSIIRRVNSWLDRVVGQRDAIDVMLYRWSYSRSALRYVAYPIRVCIWLTRWNLRWLMIGAHMISCHLSRQMEFDADKYEVRISGSHTFRVTSMNMRALDMALSLSYDALRSSALDSRLSDNLPALVMEKIRQMQADPVQLAELRDSALNAQTHMFDTHPSDAERFRAAEAENAPGIITVEAPASVLFSDFTGLSKAATLAFYREEIGPAFEDKHLVATQTLVEEEESNAEALDTLSRYFQGNVIGAHEVFLGGEPLQPPADQKAALQQMRESRQLMVANFNKTADSVRRLLRAQERVRELAHAWVLLDSGFPINPAAFGLNEISLHAVMRARQAADQELRMAEIQLDEQTRGSQRRLITGLQLLRVPKVAERIDDALKRQQTTTKLLQTLLHLQPMWHRMTRIRELNLALELLISLIARGIEKNPYLNHKVVTISREIGKTLAEMLTRLTVAPYPFEHGSGQISIAEYAIKSGVPPEGHVGEMLYVSDKFHGRLWTLYYRSMAQLAVTAEKVEEVFGLEPLPEAMRDLGDPWDS